MNSHRPVRRASVLIRISSLPILILLAASALCPGAEKGQLDANETLYTVMAAIEAGGYGPPADSAGAHPIAAEVRKAIASRKLDSVAQLKDFFQKYPPAGPGVSQYISFALSLDNPPDFKFRYPDSELAPDVVRLRGFEQILIQFYKEAKIGDLWRQSQPAFDQVIGFYHGPISQALLEANAYLRNPTSGYLGRQFQIYVDLLGAPGLTQSRSYKNDYYVVITPSFQPPRDRIEQAMRAQVQEVRHAYLHYLLDPLATKYSENIEKKKSLVDFAMGAPALNDNYKNDFLLLTTESLIKAVETRLAPGGPAKRQAMVNDALAEGFILTPYFYEQLPAFERDARAMRLYYPDMIDSIDLRKETRRLDQVKFTEKPPEPKPELAAIPEKPKTPAELALDKAEQLYADKDFEPAKQAYQAVLEKPRENTSHARAYYGLARIAIRQNDAALAERMFQKTLDASPDDETKAWAFYYLGRLADARGDGETAEKNYRSALSIPSAPPQVRTDARRGVEGAFHRKG